MMDDMGIFLSALSILKFTYSFDGERMDIDFICASETVH